MTTKGRARLPLQIKYVSTSEDKHQLQVQALLITKDRKART